MYNICKEYINLHFTVPQFPMSFITIDLLGPYCKTEKEISMHELLYTC